MRAEQDGAMSGADGRRGNGDLFALRMTEFLSAKLCHDLVSAIGAISNGIEILEEEPEFAQDAGRLIGQSARQAARRLQYFRLAYGATAAIPDDRARIACQELFTEGRVSLVWPTDLPAYPVGGLKLVMNLVLLMAESLPRGGTVTVLAGDARTISVMAEGEGVRLNEPVPALLDCRGDLDDLTARTVHAAFTGALVRQMAGCLTVRHDPADGRIAVDVAL